MSEQEKIALLEELLEVESGSLTKKSVLADYPEWDSLAIISILTYFENELGIKLQPKQVKEFENIGDILKLM